MADDTPTSKATPPDIVLRRSPPPVTRFSRRMLMALLGLGLTAVCAALFYGLGRQPPGLKQPELYSPKSPVAESLNALPSTYGDIKKPVPQLGPPLPGDLGKAVLDQDRRSATPPIGAVDDDGAREALAREAEQARVSKVQFTIGAKGRVDVPAAGTAAASTPAGVGATGLMAPSVDPDAAQNGQDEKLAFLRPPAGLAAAISAHRIEPPASPYVVGAGSVIRAALRTAVNSDLPGAVLAQVTEKVCDSASQRWLLIPQGAQLIGEVDSQVSYGQQRLLVAWTELKFPDQSTLVLDRLPAADLSGASGLDADADYHTWRLAKGVILSSLLGISSELAADTGTRDSNRIIVGARDSANQSVEQVGQRITSKELAIQPTLIREAGYPFAILVSRDLVLRPLGPC